MSKNSSLARNRRFLTSAAYCTVNSVAAAENTINKFYKIHERNIVLGASAPS